MKTKLAVSRCCCPTDFEPCEELIWEDYPTGMELHFPATSPFAGPSAYRMTLTSTQFPTGFLCNPPTTFEYHPPDPLISGDVLGFSGFIPWQQQTSTANSSMANGTLTEELDFGQVIADIPFPTGFVGNVVQFGFNTYVYSMQTREVRIGISAFCSTGWYSCELISYCRYFGATNDGAGPETCTMMHSAGMRFFYPVTQPGMPQRLRALLENYGPFYTWDDAYTAQQHNNWVLDPPHNLTPPNILSLPEYDDANQLYAFGEHIGAGPAGYHSQYRGGLSVVSPGTEGGSVIYHTVSRGYRPVAAPKYYYPPCGSNHHAHQVQYSSAVPVLSIAG